MREHPIIFSSTMVRAILAGRKHQTRRAVRHPEQYEHIRGCSFRYPYGQPGDVLWCRETWATEKALDSLSPKSLEHAAIVASRLTLEITAVRVEQLHEITEEDCYREGITDFRAIFPKIAKLHHAQYCFRQIWDFSNAKRGYGWATNPWATS